MKKYKVVAVNYLNTKPLLYGIFQSGLEKEIDLQLEIPSVCAQKLKDGSVDFGLVPVAILPELENASVFSDYCIGSEGAVDTVGIFSEVPLDSIETLYLDYHSRTSVELVQILLKEYWKTSPKLINAKAGFENKISGSTAGLIIGDRAIVNKKKFHHFYDLGEAWKAYTGLPFVFAAWVATTPISRDFIERFNKALQLGMEQIPKLTYLIPSPSPDFDLNHYFTNYISYPFDATKKNALDLFLSKMCGTTATLEKIEIH